MSTPCYAGLLSEELLLEIDFLSISLPFGFHQHGKAQGFFVGYGELANIVNCCSFADFSQLYSAFLPGEIGRRSADF